MRAPAALLLLIAAWSSVSVAQTQQSPAGGGGGGRYFGLELGALSQLHHGVRGRLYAVDARTLFLADFHYDGEGPAAFFYVGTSKTPGAGGVRLRDERGGTGPLRRYRGESLTLALPEGKTLRDFKWFSVWCDEFSVNFGDARWSRSVEFPRPARVGALRGVHGVSSDPVVVVDAQTLLVPNFSYDGEAPDAKFWVGRGDKPSPQGLRIPDENGKEAPLRRYDKKTIVLTLPGELTVFDIDHFGVWCEAFTVDFGHVKLPRAAVANVPPSLSMLGVSPQSKLNCEVLYDELAFEVRWAVAGDSIVLQLVAKLEDGEYMSFGISGSDTSSQMVGGDVAVAWVDKNTLKGYANDYYLDAKSQCAGVRGSCPDERLGERTNSIRLLNAALVNGYSIVTYQRALHAADELDRPVLTNRSQPVIWALGPLNSRDEVSYHHHFTKGDKFIEFGRPPLWNCPMPEGEDETGRPTTAPPAPAAPSPNAPSANLSAGTAVTTLQNRVQITPNPVPTPAPAPKVQPWEIPPIQCYEPPDGVFYAQMGPTGGKQGYPAITGHVGWGISWYINGLLIPEITVVRGKRYTFVVEGGSNPDVPARYHPFYITDDPVGGYFHKTDDEKKNIKIFAGVRRTRSGELLPTGVGRLCNWTPDNNGPEADEFPSFGAYQRSLTLVCEEGNPGVVTFTPDKDTPDTVYYQCFTHRYLGWKIHVVDECDYEAEESGVSETVVSPPQAQPQRSDVDLQQEESIQVHSRVRPDSNFLDQHKKVEKIINTKTTYNDFSSDKGGLTGEILTPDSDTSPPQLRNPQEYELPIVTNGQIRDVIQAVENLESRMKESARRNFTQQYSTASSPHQYQVYEEVKEMFVPEQPVREEDEYIIEKGKLPNSYFLPPNQKPLTLQSVLKPNGMSAPSGNMRPPFRHPTPPEIKLRRPPPHQINQKHNGGYPLQMPSHHGPHGVPKKPYSKPSFNKMPQNGNRPPPQQPNGAPNMNRPPHHQSLPHFGKPMFTQMQPNSHMKPPPAQKMQPPSQKPQVQKVYPTQNSPVPPTITVPQNGGIQSTVQSPPNGQVQSIIIGKRPGNGPSPTQSQTLNLGRTDMIANQIVKSHIMLPGAADTISQASIQHTFINQPGQIILGKPMDHPVPLDQQMSSTKLHVVNAETPPPEPNSSTLRIRLPNDRLPSPNTEIKSSELIGESVLEPSTLAPAVNTGFKPNTIVIESGFKPIIREPLMDRNSDYDDGKSGTNRREDTDVDEDYEESPQPINHVYQTPSDKITETFEPMFIPSPLDTMFPSDDNTRTKEVFPKNHAKEDRPHPVYVKTDTELNALFSKKNMDKEVPADMVMESDRVSPQYLPPDPKLPKEHSQKLSNSEQTFTTYDGKVVSAATLTGVPDIKPPAPKLFSSKLPANTELLLKTPQFGPFKGEIPPLLSGPPVPIEQNTTHNSKTDDKITHLKLVNAFHEGEETPEDELKAEESVKREVVAETEKPQEKSEDREEEEEEEEYEDEEESEARRRRRRDTKATHFERGEVVEQTYTKSPKSVDTKNQMDFHKVANKASNLNWSYLLVLLSVCLKLF